MIYQKNDDGSILRIDDNTSIPFDPENRDYIEFLKSGEVAQDKPVFIIHSIDMRQARLSLLHFGLLDFVDTAVKKMDRAAQIEWEYATFVIRDNPIVLQLEQSLSGQAVTIDDFFNYGASL